jgi:hypothetical protein
MARERTPAGNILALSRSREEQTSVMEDAATSYMPTNIDLDVWLPDEGSPKANETEGKKVISPKNAENHRSDRREMSAPKPSVGATADPAKRKRVSLYLDDDVLTKIFRVSLEQHEQLSAATHRLILEALKARGL